MEDICKVVVDCLGSDKGPEEVILGAANALSKYKQLFITLVGPKDLINKIMEENHIESSRFKVVEAKDTISNYENPMTGIMSKPDSSLVKGFLEALNNDNIGYVSCGNTGALLMGSFRFLSTPERTRPCLAAVLPTVNNGFTMLVDTGATNDCTSGELFNFAHLGNDFMKKVFKIDNPRIGLLSNGAESSKGNHLVKETYPLLENDKSLNFVGNIEGNMTLSGNCDVLVSDGFAGNQALKNSEGMAKVLMGEIVKYSKVNNKPELMDLVYYLKSKFDFSSLGAGIVLGVKKTVLKCRGNSNAQAIVSACEMLLNLQNGDNFYKGKI